MLKHDGILGLTTDRLNHQHHIMKEEYGGLLHPQIPIDDKEDLMIVDIGTGTWLEPRFP